MSETMDIGFLGLGQMGAAIAERLLAKDWRLHVHDPAPSAMKRFVNAGATAHDSPASVADVASIVFACLPSQQVSMEVAFGPRGVIHGSILRVYVEMSTIGREALGRIALELSRKKIETVDAPVTGGPPVARTGNLTIMVSGTRAALNAVEPMLAAVGPNIHVIGERAGMAQTMKVVNNLIMAANMIAACEGLAMGAKASLDPEMMMRVLKNGTGQSFAGCEILARAVRGTFDYGAALAVVDKDVALGLKEASALQVTMPVIRQACGVWNAACWAGYGDEDFTAIMKVVERRNSTLIRSGT